MGGKSPKLVVLSIGLGCLSLLLSGLCLVFLFTRDSQWENEITSRLEDLEEENDLLLEHTEEPSAAGQSGRPELCNLLPDPGPCSSKVNRWYYLEKEADCIQFPWGGCQGNDNNFVSLAQCRATCGVPARKVRPLHLSDRAAAAPAVYVPRRPLLPASPTEAFQASDCLQPPDSGPCANRLTRFYYSDGECQRFEYGGCAGNTNNFFTKAECERRCAVTDEASRRLFRDGQTGEAGPGAVITTERGMTRPRGARTEGSWVAGGAGAATAGKDICLLPEETGDCESRLPRFRWDFRTKQCVSFMWSGCGGNSNNFISALKCRKRCK